MGLRAFKIIRMKLSVPTAQFSLKKVERRDWICITFQILTSTVCTISSPKSGMTATHQMYRHGIGSEVHLNIGKYNARSYGSVYKIIHCYIVKAVNGF